jgi:hypothetical protein
VSQRTEQKQQNASGFPLGHLIAIDVNGRTDEDLLVRTTTTKRLVKNDRTHPPEGRMLYIRSLTTKPKIKKEIEIHTLEKAASRAKKTPAEAAVAERVASARSRAPAVVVISDG